jgi:hypothetical protein
MRRVPVFAVLLLLVNLPAPRRVAAAMPDGPDSSAAPAPAAAAAGPAKGSSEGRIPIGVGVKVSMLGIGGEVALAVSHRSNVRFGFNAFSYGHTFDKDGVTYKGTLDLRSAQATYDLFFLKEFHISPGILIYNGNKLTANASVPGGQSFTLNNVNYLSDPADPVTGTGKLTVYKAAPMFLVGFGNLVPRSRHFSTSFEIGAAYQGPPRVTLNLSGSACDSTGLFCRSITSDPTIQANVVSEQAKLNKSASPYKFYPVISFGVGFKF